MESESSSTKDGRQLRVITLNCWGLKFLSKHRHQRLSQIGIELANSSRPPDIVGLQECWTQEDYHAIREHTKDILPYSKFYYGGIFGTGLAILSRHPIVRSSMYTYPLNGRPTAFFRGDWFVGKGVACATIQLPWQGQGAASKSHKGNLVEVFCTHLHAPYEREPNDSYLCHRTAQAWEIAKLMDAAAARSSLVLGLGDFNMRAASLAHRLVEAHAPVVDVWKILRPDSSIAAAEDLDERDRGRPMPNVQFNLAENGTTCDSGANTWRWDEHRRKRLGRGIRVEADMKSDDPRGKRLDYIFAGNGCVSPQEHKWRIDNVEVGMIMRHPELHCSLSDHFSVEAEFFLDTPSQYQRNVKRQEPHRSKSLHREQVILEPQVYGHILNVTASYMGRERRQRRLRLTHFGVSLFVSIACLVAVWWSPRNFVAFLLMLLSTLGLAAGVIDGLIGGLFVSSELRALKEFEWEVKNAEKSARLVRAGEQGRDDLRTQGKS